MSITLINNSTQKALTTLARAKVFLGIGDDSKDQLLTLLINHATGFVERYLKRKLLSQTYTQEVYDGTGTNTLILKNWPVTTFTLLEEDENADNSASWDTVNSDDYFAQEDGRIISNNFTFQDTPKRYRVTYVAGYKIDFDNENNPSLHTLPFELEFIALKLISGAYNTRKSSGIKSEKVGDLSVTYGSISSGDDEIKELLGKYAHITI